eukprot:14224606-Alexandrium_andersonii.AAC.1
MVGRRWRMSGWLEGGRSFSCVACDRVGQMVPLQGRTGLGRVLQCGSLPTANPAYVVVGGRA